MKRDYKKEEKDYKKAIKELKRQMINGWGKRCKKKAKGCICCFAWSAFDVLDSNF